MLDNRYSSFCRSASWMVLLLLVTAVMSGCAASRLEPSAWQDSRIEMVWPQPPETSRVKLVRIIQGPKDVVVSEKGAVGKFLDFMLGDKNEYLGFFTPHCIAADGNGLIYVADPSLGLVHKYDLASREVSYIAEAGTQRLGSPVGVVLDRQGNLYVTDAQRAAIFKFTAEGVLLSELDVKDLLRRPTGIAINSRGEKIVADSLVNKVFVFGPDDQLKSELTGPDFKETFNMPTYVAVDASDNVYVTDSMNFTVRVFDSTGKYLRSQGQIGDSPGSFARPKGLALDSDSNLYVLDAIFGNFQMFNQQGQLLLYVSQEGTRPGELMLPSGIFIDRDDRIYVADTFNHRIQIYQYLKEKALK